MKFDESDELEVEFECGEVEELDGFEVGLEVGVEVGCGEVEEVDESDEFELEFESGEGEGEGVGGATHKQHPYLQMYFNPCG